MSMSSLSAQLAALNSSASGGRNVGSSFPASRSQEDAIGRGVGHSVKHGHTFHGGSSRFKPSVLYADAKEASDVPLTTLRENCVSSLRQVAKLTESEAFVEPQYLLTLCGVHSLNFERGLATRAENDRIDDIVENILTLLSTVLGESSSSSCFSSALHILEYLLRRYNIHARPRTAERLLVAILPHHEQPLFSRVLQLVDLASMSTWTFLRPHAAKGAPTVSRLVLSKRASKDTVLLKHCCQLAQNASRIHAAEHGDTLMESPRRGVSRVISFAAAVVVEALTMQARNTGTISEPSLRCVLPFVLSSVGESKHGVGLACLCPDWRGFGLVLTSCVAGHCAFAGKVRERIATGLACGALETFRSLEKLDQAGVTGDNETSVAIERSADALVVLISVLMQSVHDEASEGASTLVAFSTHPRRGASPELVGVDLPLRTYQSLLRLPCLTSCLGHLHDNCDLDISHFVASLFSVGLSRIHLSADVRSLQLILDIIREPRLLSLWQDSSLRLTASASHTVVIRCATHPEGSRDMDNQKIVLETLRKVDVSSCDAGIATAVSHLFGRKRKSKSKERVTSLLGLSENFQDPGSRIDEMGASTSQEYVQFLPAMIALEHADPTVRLHAIRRLSGEYEEGVGTDELAIAFFRHLRMEENLIVATAAGSSLLGLLRSGSVTYVEGMVDMTLTAISRWTVICYGTSPDSEQCRLSDDRVKFLALCLDIAGHVGCMLIRRSGRLIRTSDFRSAVHAIVAHLELPKGFDESLAAAVTKSAQEALYRCFGKDRRKLGRGSTTGISMFLLSNQDLRLAHRGEIMTHGGKLETNTSRAAMKVRYLWTYLRALADGAKKTTAKTNQDELQNIVLDSLATSLSILTNSLDAIAQCDIDEILRCLGHSAKLLHAVPPEEIVRLFISLASIDEKSYVEGVGIPAILMYCGNESIDNLALLLEAASRDGSSCKIVVCLLKTAMTSLSRLGQPTSNKVSKAVVLTLALLGHPDQEVREAAIGLMGQLKDTQCKNPVGSVLSAREICCVASSSDSASSIRIGGNFALASLLSTCVRNSNAPEELRRFVLSECTAIASDMEIGGCRSVASLLSSLELAGEHTWPLLGRWEMTGKPICKAFIDRGENCRGGKIPGDLVEAVARMLKGVKVDDATSLSEGVSSVVISTGPSVRGTRARSYSLGKMPGVSFVDPYPLEMHDVLIGCLEHPGVAEGSNPIIKELCNCIVRIVVGSSSWVEAVFVDLTRPTQLALASRLLSARETIIEAGPAFLGLPLDGLGVGFLLAEKDDAHGNLSKITFLADYARLNSSRLRDDSGFNDLFVALFDRLSDLSEVEDCRAEHNDAEEYARHNVLLALSDLASEAAQARGSKRKKSLLTKKKLASRVELMVHLLGNTENGVRCLASSKSRSVALSLLTSLCELHPESVVGALVPAMLTSTIRMREALPENPVRNALLSVVPVFHRFAPSARLSMFDLFGPLLDDLEKLTSAEIQAELCRYTVDALSTIALACDGNTNLIGSFVCSYLFHTSGVNSETELKDKKVVFAARIIQHAPITDQVASILQILAYSHGMILTLSNKKTSDEPRYTSMRFDMDGIERMTSKSTSEILTDHSRRRAMKLSTANQLRAVTLCLSEGEMRSFILGANEAELSLRLWQDLLVLQSTVLQEDDTLLRDERGFLELCRSLITQCLGQVQSLLPTHLFVASAASLLKESADLDLQSRALRFVADKVSASDHESPEASIFLDLVPPLVDIVQSPQGETDSVESTLLLKQSALLAAESLARTLGYSISGREAGRASESFLSLLRSAAAAVKEQSRSIVEEDETPSESSYQIMSSAALCASTIVRVLKIKALQVLPQLIQPLMQTLSHVNKLDIDGARKTQPDVLQLSILRALMAIVDVLPSFLSPYLAQLLSRSLLPSRVLRQGGSDIANAVKAAAYRIDGIFSTRVPARQLIPAAWGAVEQYGPCSVDEKLSVLSIIEQSYRSSSKNELSAVTNSTFYLIANAYDEGANGDIRAPLMDMGNQVLLAMVLKMSESELRPFYSSLREWSRGENKEARQMATRKHAFWSASNLLSKELRMIFLPHFSTVATDAVEDLNQAVSVLFIQSQSVNVSQGKKRRRLGVDEPVNTITNKSVGLSFLPSLLRCLEHVFKADAHEGGAWIRADDGHRHSSLLEPLTKLLQCRVPSDLFTAASPWTSTGTPFEWLVIGDDSHPGSVVACLTALATAAGNEQLWKPLNHGVLNACGNEHRPEVRKAGLKCLLSLLETLGEEYMVLLPECLPVLSELLEDSDEDIASLSQECVRLGEELLGESLHESLR